MKRIEERIRELKDKTIKITQAEQQRQNKRPSKRTEFCFRGWSSLESLKNKTKQKNPWLLNFSILKVKICLLQLVYLLFVFAETFHVFAKLYLLKILFQVCLYY